MESEAEYNIVPGARSNSKLLQSINEKQFYRKNRKTQSITIYLCRVDNCNARVIMDDATEKCHKAKNSVHNHSTQEEYHKQTVINKMKNECAEPKILAKTKNNIGSVRDIFETNIMNNQNVNLDFQVMSRNLLHLNHDVFGMQPTTSE